MDQSHPFPGFSVIKLFSLLGQNKLVFVLGRPFHSSLMFVSKTTLESAPLGWACKRSSLSASNAEKMVLRRCHLGSML
jgi:hypothetical protein